MELNIIDETENSLFNRKEITARIKTDSSPQRYEVMQKLAEKYSTDLDNIKIKGIKGNFGSNEFKVKANIYSTKEERENVEGKKKKDDEIKKKLEEEKKAAEQPKEESGEGSKEESQESGESDKEKKEESKEENKQSEENKEEKSE